MWSIDQVFPSYIGEVLDEVEEVAVWHKGVAAHLKIVDECGEVQVLEIIPTSVGTCEE